MDGNGLVELAGVGKSGVVIGTEGETRVVDPDAPESDKFFSVSDPSGGSLVAWSVSGSSRTGTEKRDKGGYTNCFEFVCAGETQEDRLGGNRLESFLLCWMRSDIG